MSNEVINVVQSFKPWSPLDLGDNLHLFLSTSNTNTMMQEDGIGGTPITNTSIDGDSVGFLYDLSKNSLLLSSEGNQFPLLDSDLTRKSFLTFNGFDEDYVVQNSKKIFREFYKSSPNFRIAFYIKMGAGSDGIFNYITDSLKGTGANNGFSIQRNSSNKLRFQTAVGGGNKINYTSTQSLAEVDGWIKIEISVSASGTGTGEMKIGNVTENFDVPVGTDDVDMTFDLTLFSGADGVGTSNPLNASVSDFIITTFTADLTEYANYNPNRNVDLFNILYMDIDYNDSANIWEDEIRTIAITNNQPIALIDSKNKSTLGDINRYLSSSVLAERPLFKTAQINGLSVGDWDGINDNLVISEITQTGGKYTMFFVVKNIDSTLGSHFASGAFYMTITGSSYISNTPDPYFVVHPNDGSNTGQSVLKNKLDEFNVLAFRRNGSNMSLWTGNKLKTEAVNSAKVQILDFGLEAIAGWQMDGQYARFIMYNGTMTDAQITAKIDEINSTYNI